MTTPKIETKDVKTVEAQIIGEILSAARARAKIDAHDMSAVARAVLERASKTAKPCEDGVAHPAQRPKQAGQKRIRFRMDAGKYEIVKDRIRRSGISMTAALEEGLERYARTGDF